MVLDSRIVDLLQRWEQLRAEGHEATPEELCRDCPDCLEEFVMRLRALQTIQTLRGTPHESAGSATPTVPAGLPAFADYQVLGELGHGGMGVVYQAYDRKRREMVALKTLHRMDASALYRFKQEFRALAEVTHPHLVGLYEFVTLGPQCFIVMELVDGVHFLAHVRSGAGSLSHTVDYGSDPPAESDAERVDFTTNALYALSPQQYERLRAGLRQLAQGIVALHALGKLHRDIKPSNVMVTPQGRVVLMDLGLTAELDWAGVHQSTEQHVTGTVAYMAPEQAASQAQSPASDWYSVGAMLYEALTGRLPFAGTPFQVLMAKQNREPQPPREIVPGIPADLKELCLALLRRSPEARPDGHEALRRLGGTSSREEVPGVRSVQSRRTSFVGRESQLAELKDAFGAVLRGRPAVVRMKGRSGHGKSMLAQHFLDQLLQTGEAVVLAGKCYERESVAFKTLDSSMDALSRYLRRLPAHEAEALLPREVHLLARVFPVLSRVDAVARAPGRAAEIADPQEVRRRASSALRELLARLGDRKPLVVFIDDLQWGDLDGATLLAELLSPPDPPVLLLLACYRSEDVETSPCLEILHKALEKAGSSLEQRQLSVDPLDPQETYGLARMLLGRADSAGQAEAAAIAKESGGNPYFVQVLAQSLASASGISDSPASAGTLVLDEVLWARIQALPDEPRRLLEVVAVSGRPLRLEDARRAAEASVDEHGTLAVLRGTRLIRSSGSAEGEVVETYHDRIRETILSHLPADTAKSLHHRIATVLESSAPELERGGAVGGQARPSQQRSSKCFFDLAYHFDAAGDSGRALPYALAMADQARSRYALELAEQLYRIAERGAAAADEGMRHRVASSLGDVLMLRGRYPDAAIRFRAALASTSDTLSQAQTEGKLAELAFKQGDMKTSISANERALRMLGNRVPRWSATFFLGLLRETLVQYLHTTFPRFFLARKPLEGAEQRLLTIRLHNRLTYCYWFGRDKISCLWTHLRGMNLAERHPPTRELAQAYSLHAPVMHLIARFSRGISYAQKSFTIYKALDDVWGQGQSLHFYGHVLYAASRFEECIEKCRTAIQMLERTGDYWEVNVARYHIALSLYRLGKLPDAIGEAERMYRSGLELGDIQASGGALDPWVRASGGRVDLAGMQTELRRPREDVQGSAMVMLAEGVRLFLLDRVEEAATVFENAHALAEKAGVQNVYVYPHVPWLASALRRQAEKSPESPPGIRSNLLQRANKVARRALRTARTLRNDLPHALRECGLLAALQGQANQARKDLDESLAVAEQQSARFEHAQTLLARGRVGQKHGWPEAQQDLTTARQALRAIRADFALDDAATS
jgi:two-component system sensor kinase